jgi:hypothetical protein
MGKAKRCRTVAISASVAALGAASCPTARAEAPNEQPSSPPPTVTSARAARTGGQWSGGVRLASGKWFAVSCAPSSCVAIGPDGQAFAGNGGAWGSLPSAGPGESVENVSSISCPTASTCVAVDLDMEAIQYANGTWGSPVALVPSERGVTFMGASVSCATAGFCAAVDGAGDAVVYAGGAWGRARRVSRYGIASVSCPRAGYCVALDNDGDALYYADGSWTRPRRVDALTAPSSVSCTSPRRCVALLDSELGGTYATTYDGQTWSAPALIAGQRGAAGNDLNSVSCASASFCLAVGGNGHAAVYDGRAWHETRFSDRRNNTAEASCATASRCVVVDSNGDAYTYTGN